MHNAQRRTQNAERKMQGWMATLMVQGPRFLFIPSAQRQKCKLHCIIIITCTTRTVGMLSLSPFPSPSPSFSSIFRLVLRWWIYHCRYHIQMECFNRARLSWCLWLHLPILISYTNPTFIFFSFYQLFFSFIFFLPGKKKAR